MAPKKGSKSGGGGAGDAPKTKKAEMAQQRTFQSLSRSLGSYLQDDFGKQQAFCIAQINANPSWVPWLTALFKHADVDRLVREFHAGGTPAGAEPEKQGGGLGGRRIPQRTRKLVKVPLSIKAEILGSILDGFLPSSHGQDEKLTDATWMRALHIDETTPFPKDPQAMFVNALAAMAKRRYTLMGQRMRGVAFSPSTTAEDVFLWAVEKGTTLCYLPLQTTHALPRMQTEEGRDASWVVDDKWSWSAQLTVPGQAANLCIDCWSLVEDADPGEAWDFSYADCEPADMVMAEAATPKQGEQQASGSCKRAPSFHLSPMVAKRAAE